MSHATPLATIELPEIVSRYASGESVQTLAQEAGVHRATLYRWMLAGTGDKQYHGLVTHCLVQRVSEADQALETAKEPCDIARARETAKFARMDLERRRPSLYGQKQELTVAHHVTLDSTLGDAVAELLEHARTRREKVIEGQSTATIDHTAEISSSD